ncbi:hypothetical protein BGZ83_009609 [Gryganskiella cystojenkinii]|nr:hypothetical protein BGZ83_009609 [Gryganskiella cystojenkinii]
MTDNTQLDFLQYLYEVFIFEYTFIYGGGTRVPHHYIARDYVMVADISERYATRIRNPCHHFIRRYGLDHTEGVIDNFLPDYTPRVLPYCLSTNNPRNPHPNDYYYYGYESNHNTGQIILPTWTQQLQEEFLKRYADLVPLEFQDDLAFFVFGMRRTLKTQGSGGAVLPVYGNLGSIKKFTRTRTEERRREKSKKQRIREAHQATAKKKAQEQEAIRQEQDHIKKRQFDAKVEDFLHRLVATNKVTEIRTKAIESLRMRLVDDLRGYFGHVFLIMFLYGSYASGLATNESDADFVLGDWHGTVDSVQILAQALKASGYRVDLILEKARVPIVTFYDPTTKITCDMCINQLMSISNTRLIETYREIDNDRFLPLWFAIRHLAKKHDILSGRKHYLSTYALSIMLIAFLQHELILPKLQCQPQRKMRREYEDGWDCSYDHNADDYKAKAKENTRTVTDLFKRFIAYFEPANFDYKKNEVNIRLGETRMRDVSVAKGKEAKQKLRDAPMCILDPFIRNRNVAGNISSGTMMRIQQAFTLASQAIKNKDFDALF